MYTNAPVVDLDYSDRELLVYRVISGVAKIKIDDKIFKVYPPTTEDYLDACEAYFETMHRLYNVGILDEDEMLQQMIERDLWSYHKEDDLKKIKDKIEELKIGAFNNRRDTLGLNKIKNNIRALEAQYYKLISIKNMYFGNTCEGMAMSEKTSHIIKSSTRLNGQIYSFDDKNSVSIRHLISEYSTFHDIEDSMLRYLSRTEPWRSIFSTKIQAGQCMFDSSREITNNQRSILAWTQMYDSVYESMDCPDSYVIADDDMLDGWFLVQAKKRKQEKSQSDLDNSIKSDKIKGSQEVFSVAKNKEEVQSIESLNDMRAKMIKKQREQLIKNAKGPIPQGAFKDEQMKLANQSHDMYKGKFKGK